MNDVDYVFRAAVLKQVPSCEFFPMEAVKTNCIGTRHGDKEFKTPLTREEHIIAQDFDGFYRGPADQRDLNYEESFNKGAQKHLQERNTIRIIGKG